MHGITTRAAVAVAFACALGACNKEDAADKQALPHDSAATPATAPVSTALAAWNVQFDDPSAQGFQMTEQPGGGWLVDTGPTGGIAWRDRDQVEGGAFGASATFSVPSSAGGGQGYGLLVGGRHLKDPDQAYTAFLIRSDGHYAIQRHEGKTSTPLVDWTASPAIHQADHGGGTAENAVAVHADATATHFAVNGTEVQSLPNDRAQPYGVAGLKLDKGSQLTVKAFDMSGQGTGDTAGPPAPGKPDSGAAPPR